MSQEEQEQQEEPHQNFVQTQKFFFTKNFVQTQIFVSPKKFQTWNFSQTQNFFWHKMNFNENDLWRDKTKLLNLRFSTLHSAKVLLKLEFDTKDQVLLCLLLYISIWSINVNIYIIQLHWWYMLIFCAWFDRKVFS